MIFKPISFNGIKSIDENGITFEIDVLFKHNFLAPIIVDSLSGDLYIVNDKIKITSNDKIGKFVCPNSLKLEHGKENIIKLDLTLYYTDMFFSNIPKADFNIEYKIDIDVSGNCVLLPLNLFVKEIIGSIKKLSFNNIEYEIYIKSCFPCNCFRKKISGNINLPLIRSYGL